jgi:antitoxin VapB
MDTAKLFKNGQSQAVRLPKQYAFKGTEVYVKRIGGIVMLVPKNENPWNLFRDSLEKFTEDAFNFKREQGTPEKRHRIA